MLPVAAWGPNFLNGTGIPLNGGTNSAGNTVIDYGLPNSVRVDTDSQNRLSIESRNTISGLYFLEQTTARCRMPATTTKWLTQIHTRAQVAGVTWVWTPDSVWINEARLATTACTNPPSRMPHRSASDYGLNTGVTNPLYGGCTHQRVGLWLSVSE